MVFKEGELASVHCPLRIPALNPISRKGKIVLLLVGAREELSPGLVLGCVSTSIFFFFFLNGLDWAKIYSTKPPFSSYVQKDMKSMFGTY